MSAAAVQGPALENADVNNERKEGSGMLKGISPVVSPELLKTLAEMGHGDEIVISDAHFPGHTFNPRVVRADGIDERIRHLRSVFGNGLRGGMLQHLHTLERILGIVAQLFDLIQRGFVHGFAALAAASFSFLKTATALLLWIISATAVRNPSTV